ncbi:MAG: hypothetical protein ACYC4S_00650 [Rhodoferax sp.]
MATNATVITLQADVNRFTADMKRAGNATEQAMAQMHNSTSAVNSAMIGLAKGALAALSIDFFAGMIKGAIDSMDALNDLKDATGASIANISALEDVAVRTGANIDTVGTAMIKFQKVLMDAKPGSQAELGLTALGLSAQSLKNMDLGDAMLQYAKAMDQFADDGDKARLMLEQTGKSIKELAPFLKDLAEQEKLVGTVSAEQALEAEKFNKELANMKKNAQDVAREIAGPLITAFNNFMTAQREAKKEGKFGIFTSMQDMVAREGRLSDANKTGSWGAPVGNAGRGRVNPDLVKPGVGEIPEAKKTPTKTAGQSEAQKLEADAQRFVARLKEQAETYGMAGVELLKYQMQLSKFPQVYKDEAIAHQTKIDAMKAADDANKAAIKADIEGFKTMDDLRKADAIAVQRNEDNVQAIRVGLMSEADQQAFAHEQVLAELQVFHDAKFENVALANALIEEENARHSQVLADMQSSRDMQSLAMAGNTADMLYGVLQKAGKEQSALGKAAFIASKAIAVAEIIMNTNVAASKAGSQLGIFGIPMATMIMATGYAQAGMVAGLAIAEASAEGGYDIPSGTNPITQLHEREMVLPKQQADVIRGLANNGGGAGQMAVTIVNQTTGRIDKVTEQRISPTERALIIEEAVSATAAQFSDPNSKTSRAMGRNYATQRSR